MFQVIDLEFQDLPEIIASYVLRGPQGVALVETGPGSTTARLVSGLEAAGVELAEITDILVTHIHLDHAGGAGWLARETGARVYVHHVGAPHLVDPSRLLASARRIYGDLMDPLWGEFLAVPADQVQPLYDGDAIMAAGLRLMALDTPGHANHHMAYLWDGICFTGDLAGACLPGYRHVRLPTPPPEFDLDAWRASLDRVQVLRPDRLLLTHFGLAAADPAGHLQAVRQNLDAAVDFVHRRWQAGAAEQDMIAEYAAWVAAEAAAEGCDAATVQRYEAIVPSYMQIPGLLRYFRQRQKA